MLREEWKGLALIRGGGGTIQSGWKQLGRGVVWLARQMERCWGEGRGRGGVNPGLALGNAPGSDLPVATPPPPRSFTHIFG